jgi:RND family efflux transporter MFP subunit
MIYRVMFAGAFWLLVAAYAVAQIAPAPGRPKAPVMATPTESAPPREAGERRAGGDFECLLEPRVVVQVGSPVDGVIQEVTVDRGDHVKAGQVVAKLDSGVEAASVELRKAKAEFGARKAERNVELFNRQLISAQEKDELDTEQKLNELELKKDIEALKLRTVLSPIDGVVVERYLSAGELVRTDKVKIMKLAQIDPLNVEVVVPSQVYGSIKVGMGGEVVVAAPVRGVHRAKVTVIDPVIDAASGTFGVRLELPNPGGKVPSGIKCRVRFGR